MWSDKGIVYTSGLMNELCESKVTRLTRLYPEPILVTNLKGLYLAHHLLDCAQKQPFVYANFVTSLDGRIALIDQYNGSSTPKSLTTASDWRLFQELHAQADCIITHGAYCRALVAGRLGNILQIGKRPESQDLLTWRERKGFTGQPAVVVVSSSLDFPVPDSIREHQQRFYIATGANSDKTKIKAHRERGFEVVIAGRAQTVEGRALIEFLVGQGYRSIYLLAGPQILETMLRDAVLTRLYLTLSHQLIGGTQFHTMIAGNELGKAGVLKLRELYLQAGTDSTIGQFFACFEP